MSTTPEILVLAGGLSFEREISLQSGAMLAESLRGREASVLVLDPGAELLGQLELERPDAALIALHGAAGEDGTVQSLLELANVPFVGASSDGCRLAYDKPTAKALVRQAGFKTPDALTLPGSAFREFDARRLLDVVAESMGLPLVVKPARGGSALGVSIVDDEAGLPAAVMSALHYHDVVMLERRVEGVELAVTVVDRGTGPVALPPIEVKPSGELFDYTAHYTPGATEFSASQLNPTILDSARNMATEVHEKLGLRELSRCDLIVGLTEELWFLEAAVSPGFTYTSSTTAALELAGYELGDVALDMIRAAIVRASS